MAAEAKARFFLGANSPTGFYSLYDQLMDPARAEELCSQYNVGNLKNVGNKTILRIIKDEKPMEEAVPAEASLEDLYLYYFQEEGR